MSLFHQWLLADPASKASASSIILHFGEPQYSRCLIQEIADHLNEYDDDGDGRWLPATPELVEKVRQDPSLRRLLGLEDGVLSAGADLQADYGKTLAAIEHRGRVVCLSPGAPSVDPDFADTFHAGIGPASAIHEKCHLILDPDLLDQKCIAHIVGDVFLEWLHCDKRNDLPARGNRQDTRRF